MQRPVSLLVSEVTQKDQKTKMSIFQMALSLRPLDFFEVSFLEAMRLDMI